MARTKGAANHKPTHDDTRELAAGGENSGDERDSSESSYEFPSDLSAPEFLEIAKEHEKEKKWSEAVAYYEHALRRKLDEIKEQNEFDPPELHPDLGVYWLAYGDALFIKMEETEPLLTSSNGSSSESMEDDKEAAWEALETARICFAALLKKLGEAKDLVVMQEIAEDFHEQIDQMCTEGGARTDSCALWQLGKIKNVEVATILKKVVYAKTRQGDFEEGLQRYFEAAKEYEEAVKICVMYGLRPQDALEPAIPWAQCLAATKAPETESVFELCQRLIAWEESQDTTTERKDLLRQTASDLASQMKEYADYKQQLVQEIKRACEYIRGGTPPEEATSSTSKSELEQKIKEYQDSGACAEKPAESEAKRERVDEVITDLGVVSSRKKRREESKPTE